MWARIDKGFNLFVLDEKLDLLAVLSILAEAYVDPEGFGDLGGFLFYQLINAVEEIMRLYASNTSKQVFIAFDKTASYSEATQQVVHEHKVVELSPNGHELFGWSWSRISQE